MPVILAWFLANIPTAIGIGVPIVSSLIVGLTPYPKVEGVLQKILWVLNLFSVTTHSDSPGTFKLPLMQSSAPVAAAVTKL